VVAERQTESISRENIGQAQEYERALIQRVSEESDERFLRYVREYLQHGQQHSSATILAINVNAVVDEEMGYASYSIHIQLMQGVLLLGQSPRRSLATTWQIGRVGYISPSEFEQIREHVRDTIDEFINEYLAANPDRGSPVSLPKTRIPPRGLVTGIARSQDSSSAVIGTQIVREGQSIHGVKVIKIHKDRVEFEKNGRRWTQGLNEAPGPQWR
jgi:hypothetical protein